MNRFVYIVCSSLTLLALVSCAGEDSTPSFSLAGSTVTALQGGSETSTIRFNFNPGAKDTVTLSLESPLPGISGTFDPPTVNSATPTSLLSLNVAVSVAAGDYELTVKGTSGAKVNSAKVRLLVQAPNNTPNPTPSFSLSGTSVKVVQGGSGTSTITATFEGA